jgi:dihydrofolate synthase/folylpolyglutamate synthase
VIQSPECAVITNIGLDHTAVLGDTLAKIAFEKAGIIKGGPVVSYMQEPEVASVLYGAASWRAATCALRILTRSKA